MNRHHQGFSVIEIILVIAIVAVTTLVGWQAYVLLHKAPSSSTLSTSASPLTAKTSAPAGESKVYRSDRFGFSFSYPSAWTLQDIPGYSSDQIGVKVSSPHATVVTFHTHGASGDGCHSPSETLTQSCPTVTYLNLVKSFTSTVSDPKEESLYVYGIKITAPTDMGGKTTYDVGLIKYQPADASTPPSLNSTVTGDFYSNLAMLRNNTQLRILVQGKDDTSNTSPAFIHSQEAIEAAEILKTVRVF